MKIVQLAAPTAAGGLERVVEALAIGLHRRGHEVVVATLLFEAGEEHPFVESLNREGVRVHPIQLAPRDYLGERREVGALCREFRPDLVHTHGYRIDLVDRNVVTRLRIPVVTTVHGASKMGGLKGALFEWLQRRNYRKFDAVVAVSKALHATTLSDGVPAEHLHLIPNALGRGPTEPMPREAARDELGLGDCGQVVGWVGRLIRVKGGDLFLRALARMPEPRPVGAMIGYGPEDGRLRALADDLGLGNWVRFYPEIRDAGRYFAAFDTYVMSSRSEGLPIVILEAMATGTPIVATRVGGVPDALGESEAFLVPPEDPAKLADAINVSLSNRQLALERAGGATRRLQTDFDLNTWLDRHESVYRGVVDKNEP